MSTIHFRPVCIAATLALLLAPAGTSQDRPGRKGGKDEPVAVENRSFEPVKFDLSFEGGTLEQFTTALRRAAQEQPTILLSESVRSYRVPSVELRCCQAEAALLAVSHILEPKVVVNASGPTTFSVSADPATVHPPVEIIVDIVKIKDLMPGENIPQEAVERHGARLVQAISVGLEFAAEGQQQKPSLKWHKESGLLFVRGTPGQVAIMRNIASLVEVSDKEPERRKPGENEEPAAQQNAKRK